MRTLAVLMLALTASTAHAGEDAITLKDGPGRALVEANCVMCHSLDYVPMNSPILDRQGWERTVNKMIRVMGAPIPSGDVPAIVDYLATQYGK
ncbi:MAG: cytochrome c [Betaproteobacteria bacterium]|nr:cytochrome c [Betaproteobacteria bacterium]